MIEILKIAGFILFSSVKFLFAPSTVYLTGYNFWQTLVITTIGGILGVSVFFYTGSIIFKYVNERFSSALSKKRKTFTKRNRLIIKLKSSTGIIGLAIVTPCIISIPIGSLLAAKYFRNDRRTIPFLYTAVAFWSLTLTSLTAYIGPLFD